MALLKFTSIFVYSEVRGNCRRMHYRQLISLKALWWSIIISSKEVFLNNIPYAFH